KFTSLAEAKEFADLVGYPVLVRPSYVLSGAAMKVVWGDQQLEQFLTDATNVSRDHPVVISKFLQDAAEVEVDAVSDGTDVIIGSVIEHIDNAGVHLEVARRAYRRGAREKGTTITMWKNLSRTAKPLNDRGRSTSHIR